MKTKKLTIGTVLTILGLLISILATVSNIAHDYGMLKADVNNIKDGQKDVVKKISNIQMDIAVIKDNVVRNRGKKVTQHVDIDNLELGE